MQVRVDVDDHIDGGEELLIRVEGVVEGSLDRFDGRIARVEVHLGRLSRPHGVRAMCCRMEAYAGAALKPIAVSHEGVTLTEAIHAAAAKLHRALGVALHRRNEIDVATGSEVVPTGTAGPDEGLGHLRSS